MPTLTHNKCSFYLARLACTCSQFSQNAHRASHASIKSEKVTCTRTCTGYMFCATPGASAVCIRLRRYASRRETHTSITWLAMLEHLCSCWWASSATSAMAATARTAAAGQVARGAGIGFALLARLLGQISSLVRILVRLLDLLARHGLCAVSARVAYAGDSGSLGQTEMRRLGPGLVRVLGRRRRARTARQAVVHCHLTAHVHVHGTLKITHCSERVTTAIHACHLLARCYICRILFGSKVARNGDTAVRRKRRSTAPIWQATESARHAISCPQDSEKSGYIIKYSWGSPVANVKTTRSARALSSMRETATLPSKRSPSRNGTGVLSRKSVCFQ